MEEPFEIIELKELNIGEIIANELLGLNDWNFIPVKYKLTEEFMRDCQFKLDWSNISRFQTLSEEFIREFQDKISWYYINKYQKLSEKFIKEFQHKLDIF